MSGGVRVERNGPVTTVIMNRTAGPQRGQRSGGRRVVRGVRESSTPTSRPRWRCCGAITEPSVPEPISRRSAHPRPIRRTAPAPGPMGPTRMVLSKPVIAAVSGHAVAGGLELALWCDLRVVEEDAVFGVFCRRWGVPLIDGGTVRLPRLIGHSRAMDLILTGRAVDASRGARDRVGQPGRAHRAGARAGRGAGRRARRAAPAVPARGPALGAGPVGNDRGRRDGRRVRAACRRWPPNRWPVPNGSPTAQAGTAPRSEAGPSIGPHAEVHPELPRAVCAAVRPVRRMQLVKQSPGLSLPGSSRYVVDRQSCRDQA